MNRFTYQGKLHLILPVQTFSSGFKKRDFVCETSREKWVDHAVFTAKKELADKIASLNPGDDVAVEFVLDGREWEKDGKTRWFGGATALKVELAGGANAGSLNQDDRPEAPAPSDAGDAVADDMPF